MKKILAFIAATMLMTACSEDNSTDAFGNNGSSGSNKDNLQRFSWTETREYSFIDTVHLKYYHLDHYCILNESTNSFSWITDKYQGFVNIDTITRESPNWHGFFSYKLSNDTLYECDYNGAECTDLEKIKAASVFTGSSKSLFGTWHYVGRIYEGAYIENEEPASIEMTITPTGTTEKYTYDYEARPLYYSNYFCGLFYSLFEERNDLGNSCHDYFGNIGKHNGKYSRYNSQTRTYESIPDTVMLLDNFWITSIAFDEVLVSIDDMLFNIKYQEDVKNYPITVERDLTINYNGMSCQKKTKDGKKLSKEVCEASSIETSVTYDDYCDLTGKTEKLLKRSFNNNDEFFQCIKQFNLMQ